MVKSQNADIMVAGSNPFFGPLSKWPKDVFVCELPEFLCFSPICKSQISLPVVFFHFVNSQCFHLCSLFEILPSFFAYFSKFCFRVFAT